MGKQRKPDFHDLEKVMRELVLPFYGLERAVPLLLAVGRRRENDAEHSWSVALMACMLAQHVDPTLDLGKICQFAVVHDLAEIYAGDTSAFAPDEEHQTKEERERRSVERISHEFADFPWLVKLMNDYERQESEEAKFVRSVDKIVPLYFDYLNEGVYYRENRHTQEDFTEFMKRPRAKAKIHPGAFTYHEEAMAALLSRPEFFHPSGGSPKGKTP